MTTSDTALGTGTTPIEPDVDAGSQACPDRCSDSLCVHAGAIWTDGRNARLFMGYPQELESPATQAWCEVPVASSPAQLVVLAITCRWHHGGRFGFEHLARTRVAAVDRHSGSAGASAGIVISAQLAKSMLGVASHSLAVANTDVAALLRKRACLWSFPADDRHGEILEHLAFTPGPHGLTDVYRSAKFMELLCLIAPRMSEPACPETNGIRLSGRNIEALEALRDFLSDPAAGGMTLSQLAARFGLNRNKLAHGFKRLFGQSVMSYRRRAQLLHALQLLQDRDIHVGQAAGRAGFLYPCNFSTAFKEEFGCSPKEAKRGFMPTGK